MTQVCLTRHHGSAVAQAGLGSNLADSKASRNSTGGFSIILTLSMMALLLVLLIGIISLSSTSIRTSSTSVAKTEAQSNAKMALMLALGELQKQAGSDQRITANAAILSDSNDADATDVLHPYWTGVWQSWKADDPDTAGGDEPSEHATLDISHTGMHPAYVDKKQDHFLSWLVSMPSENHGDFDAPKLLGMTAAIEPDPTATAVKLVGKGSVEDSANDRGHVSVPLIDVTSEAGRIDGRFGWWVGDQSVKANISGDDHSGDALSAADRIFRHQAPGSTGISRASGLENVDEIGFDALPSFKTLDLLEDADEPAAKGFHDINTFAQGVLADVREGGLKRDLNTLLEQDIDINDSGGEYMLYRFFTGTEERVPIQDLSAYYQLYQNDPTGAFGRRGGIEYGSAALSNAIQVGTPDFGTPTDREKTVREYTTLYRNPVPIRIQYIFAVTVVPLDPDLLVDPSKEVYDPLDTYLLVPGIMPVITLWNPNSVPLVMGGSEGRSQVFSMGCPPMNFRWTVKRASGLQQTDAPINFNYMMSGQSSSSGQANSDSDCSRILSLRFGKDEEVVFEPGEVKVFTVPDTVDANNILEENVVDATNLGRSLHDASNDYNPYGFYSCTRSSAAGAVDSGGYLVVNGRALAYALNVGYTKPIYLGVGEGDTIECQIDCEKTGFPGSAAAHANEVGGGGFQFFMIDNDNFSPPGPSSQVGRTESDHIRHYQFLSRFGGDVRRRDNDSNIDFNALMIKRGFPGGDAPIYGAADPISVSSIVSAANDGEAVPIAMFTLRAGCEAHSSMAGGYGGGRTVPSTRPFLHSGAIAPPFLDSVGIEDLYNYGWDWSVERINSIEEAIQVDPGTGRTFYGGGYTSEKGTTHVVQQEIPVLPPISIASLSHAQLGGYSLANRPNCAEVDDYFKSFIWLRGVFSGSYPENRDPDENGDSYRRTTAMGMGGMYPTVMQAIGNSYAHPNLSPDRAFSIAGRTFDNDVGNESRVFADHSYLANKALWDEFFFSSITQQPGSVRLFDESRTVDQVASEFFFGGEPLPNRRIAKYTEKLDEGGLNSILQQKDEYLDGFADKIAQYLMVDGAFNVNSTSVDSWRVLLSSLRGKPIQYLEKNGSTPTEFIPDGTPVGFGVLPGGASVNASAVEDPNSPEPWRSWREITDEQIDQLAEAIVKQVKLRGPFLSLSEFVNRRLDGSNRELSLKGALQAALDDPNVTINEAFRQNDRVLDGEPNIVNGNFEFEEAAKGPIAYGSSAYVDQADVLRNFAGQLTPRGDTFVIRAYGDSLDENGEVLARAWCEATVQRVPEYLESSDEDYLKQSDLQSPVNQTFGRKFKVVAFRWLAPDEV